MPRNVSRSPHELLTYTLRFIFTLRASAQRAGRILADRIESKAKTIYVGRFRAACSLRGPFLFTSEDPEGQAARASQTKEMRLGPTVAFQGVRGAKCHAYGIVRCL